MNDKVKKRNPDILRLEDMMGKLEPVIMDVAKKQIDPARLTRIMISAAEQDNLLLKCTQRSLALGIITACILKLEPNSWHGHCYLIPFRNSKKSEIESRRLSRKVDIYEAQFVMGYKGLVQLGYRSGAVKSINARCVYKGEQWEIIAGSPFDKIEHRPAAGVEHSGRNFGEFIELAYTVVYVEKDIPPVSHWMFHDQIEAIRKRDRIRKSGPWATDYGMMAMKTCLKQSYKLVAIGDELSMAIDIDSRMAIGESLSGLIDVPVDLPPDDEAAQVANGSTGADKIKNGLNNAKANKNPAEKTETIQDKLIDRINILKKYDQADRVTEVLNAYGVDPENHSEINDELASKILNELKGIK